MNRERLAEAAGTALAGAVLGAGTGALIRGRVPGAAVVGAVVGGANGAISGFRGVYDWSSRNGVGAFALDSSWALGTTFAGLASHVIGAIRGRPDYSSATSERKNRHVYGRGFQPRAGFAVTLGNVVSGGGDLSMPRRVQLVDRHEDIHVWQARAFGPTYPMLYVGWMIGGGAAGAVAWVAGRRDVPFGKLVESCAYYLNPLEWWAYSRDDHWPPSGKVPGLGWQRPAVAPYP